MTQGFKDIFFWFMFTGLLATLLLLMSRGDTKKQLVLITPHKSNCMSMQRTAPYADGNHVHLTISQACSSSKPCFTLRILQYYMCPGCLEAGASIACQEGRSGCTGSLLSKRTYGSMT